MMVLLSKRYCMTMRWKLSLSLIYFFLCAFSNAVEADSSDIQAFKKSWIAKALQLQNQIDIHSPLNQATFLGTHNSYNAKVYAGKWWSYVDPNQQLSIYDQLEMGIRSVEFDAHWTFDAHLKKAILLCHGLDNHIGCNIYDRPFTQGLEELRDWLQANPGSVVLLYIERHLDQHEPRLTSELEKYVGQFIFKPTEVRPQGVTTVPSCISLPGNLTKAEILKAGKQLIIVTKGCDGTTPHYQETDQFTLQWNDYVFSGIGRTQAPYDILDTSIDERFRPYPNCGKQTIFAVDPTHDSIWRIFEDRTMLSNVYSKMRKLLEYDLREMMLCGINWPAMDMLAVDDDRLEAAIWSWAPSYPQHETEAQCVIYQMNQGMKNIPCDQPVTAYACKLAYANTWQVIHTKGSWQEGERHCRDMAGFGWHFAVPINANQMFLLKSAAMGTKEIGLNYAMDQQGQWQANVNRANSF